MKQARFSAVIAITLVNFLVPVSSALCQGQTKVTVQWKYPETVPFDVGGNNMKEFWEKSTELAKEHHGHVGWTDRSASKPEWTLEGDNVTELILVEQLVIHLPNWTNYLSQPSECRQMFDKYLESIKTHEQRHVDDIKKIAEEVAYEMRLESVTKSEYLKLQRVKEWSDGKDSILRQRCDKASEEFHSTSEGGKAPTLYDCP